MKRPLLQTGANATMRTATTDLENAFSNEPPFIKVARAAELTGLHPKTIQRAAKRGALESVRPGKDYLISTAALRRWLAKGVS